MPTCYRHPDRETGLSCSECGRPVCTDCVTFAPVGLRCPDHAASGTAPKVQQKMQRVARGGGLSFLSTEAIVTKILVVANVAIYLITVAQGAGLNAPGGSLYNNWALNGPLVHQGDWWRLITSAFLHGGMIHIIFNMLALWWLGAPVEMVLGRARYIGLYFVSGLAGAAGALIANPDPRVYTVGASGAIFGLLGAGLILEYQATGSLAGNYLTLIVINLAISFAVPGISVGGHLGGLAGGIITTFAFTRGGRLSGRRIQPLDIGAILIVGAIAIGIAYFKVRGLA